MVDPNDIRELCTGNAGNGIVRGSESRRKAGIMTHKLTKAEAVAFYDSGEWRSWSAEQIAELQLFQDLLCVPFDVFHKAVEEVLGRPVWTHEFASPNHENLRAEYAETQPAPTKQEILELIPEEKRVIILLDDANGADD